MPECMNNGILSLNVKKLTNFALSLENKPKITVREFVFHYAIYVFRYLCIFEETNYPNMVGLLPGPILESKGMGAIFRKSAKKGTFEELFV